MYEVVHGKKFWSVFIVVPQHTTVLTSVPSVSSPSPLLPVRHFQHYRKYAYIGLRRCAVCFKWMKNYTTVVYTIHHRKLCWKWRSQSESCEIGGETSLEGHYFNATAAPLLGEQRSLTIAERRTIIVLKKFTLIWIKRYFQIGSVGGTAEVQPFKRPSSEWSMV